MRAKNRPAGKVVSPPPQPWLGCGVALFLLVVVMGSLVAIGAMVQRRLPTAVGGSAGPSSRATGPLESLAQKLDAALRASRPVLLGSRDPNGQSCVAVIHSGDVKDAVPDNPADLDGGPGTTMAALYCFDRQSVRSPMQDYQWHQGRLKTYLENQRESSRNSAVVVHELADEAMRLWEAAGAWSAVPTELHAEPWTRETDWPSYCLSKLNQAVAAHDLEQSRRWAGELAQAALSLEDLHRWLAFLVDDHLTALEFQRQCETLFSSAEALQLSYDVRSTVSQFPAGVLSLNALSNYYEVERQAERLFARPQLGDLTGDLTPESLWVTPGLRGPFLELLSALGPENRKTLALAARSPFHHSYLINMLFRSTAAGSVAELGAVLKRLDPRNPRASMEDLLGALMYRGHPFAGLEWADRFQPALVGAGGAIEAQAGDLDAISRACRWTHDFFASAGAAAYGGTFTLREALERKRLDCVRATDMIGAIYRNSGRGDFGNIRWSDENTGHSVAARVDLSIASEPVQILDGLSGPDQQAELWPACYFHGHAWPAALASEGNAPPYAVELYVRGLDNYVWAEGYIVRGPHAGNLTSAAIPYSPRYAAQTTRKVFDGPYPH
jgi:hypothetical protein